MEGCVFERFKGCLPAHCAELFKIKMNIYWSSLTINANWLFRMLAGQMLRSRAPSTQSPRSRRTVSSISRQAPGSAVATASLKTSPSSVDPAPTVTSCAFAGCAP